MLDLEHVLGRALNVLGDAVAMHRSEQQRAEDEEIESALDNSPFMHGRQSTTRGRLPTSGQSPFRGGGGNVRAPVHLKSLPVDRGQVASADTVRRLWCATC